jgi:hypothetical protein
MRADLQRLFGMTGLRAHIHPHDTPLVGTVRNLWVLLKSRFPVLGPTGAWMRHRSAVTVITNSRMEKRWLTTS